MMELGKSEDRQTERLKINTSKSLALSLNGYHTLLICIAQSIEGIE